MIGVDLLDYSVPQDFKTTGFTHTITKVLLRERGGNSTFEKFYIQILASILGGNSD